MISPQTEPRLPAAALSVALNERGFILQTRRSEGAPLLKLGAKTAAGA